MAYSYTYYTGSADHGGWTATLRISCGHELTTTNDTVTIKMEGAAQYSSNNATGYGIHVQVGHDAVGSYSKRYADGYGVLNYTDWVGSASGSFAFARTHSAYNVWIWSAAWGETVSGYGAAPESAGGGKTITIPAKPSYTVSFNANGGSGAPSSQTKWYGESLTLSTTKPTRTGYTFNGWNTKSDGTGTNYAAGASYTGNAALTLYAKWTINTWTVSYNGNSNTGGSTASQTKTYNTALTLRANGFTRTDFAFKRWNTKSDDTGTAYNASASYTGNAALTLYAIWNRTVTFNANGGSGAPSAQTAVATSAITLSSTKPTRTSYVFKRWNTNTSDSGTAYSPGASYAKNLGSTTLYAIWNPVVSYDANGGSGAPSSQTKTYGTALTLSTAVPTRTGFSFKQWNTNSSGTGTAYSSGASYTSNEAATLYAIWNATVSYDANGGSGAPASQTAAYGSTITLSSTVPTRAGRTFLGWNTASDGSGTDYSGGDSYSASNGGMTLYAKWRVDIVVSGLTCQLTDSNGTPDALGRYVTVSASYDTTSSGNDCTYFGATLTVAGSSSELHAETTGATGSESFTFGPYAYDDLTPAGNTSVGTLTASNADGSIEHALKTAATGYAAPKVASLVAFRETGRQGADDGTDLGIEVGWSVFQTASQSRPASVALELTDLSTGTVVAERTWTGTVDNPATLHVYPDSGLYPDDVLVDGELVNVERNYAARVTVYDAWKSAVRTDMVTVAYFTMDFLAGGHGVAIGKPSTLEMLDVGMDASFDGDVAVSGDLDVSGDLCVAGNVTGLGEVSATDSNLLVHNLTEKANAIAATQSAAGLMSAADKAKLDGIASGAQVNSVTGVKGNAETSYRTGNVNVTPANIGALPLSGGSLTGNLVLEDVNLYIDSSAIDRDTTTYPSSDTYGKILYFRDKDNEAIGRIRFLWNSAGRMTMQLGVITENTSNSEVSNWLQLHIAKDGTQTYGVSSPANFRSAISAHTRYTQLYYNATGTTGTVTLSATAANYTWLRIYVRSTDDNNQCGSVDVYSPNNKHVSLELTMPTSSGVWIKSRLVKISTTSITNVANACALAAGSTSDKNTNNVIYIYRVDGWTN